MATLSTYLHFNGIAEEAFNFYKSVFGGEFAMLQRYKDVPHDVHVNAPEAAGSDKIMHVALPVGDSVLMGSDWPESMGSATIGNNFNISIQPKSEEEAKRFFEGLSAGGRINMPLDKTFWGAYFGMLTDKFGVSWMVNYDLNQK